MIYKNLRIITKDKDFLGFIEIDDQGNITRLESGKTELDGKDCSGQILMPGFIDSHTHGGYGLDFSDINLKNDSQFYNNFLNKTKEEGVVAFAGASVTLSEEKLLFLSKNISELKKTKSDLPKMVAWYFEGPFISIQKKGAHEESLIKPMDSKILDNLKVENIDNTPLILTVAPESGKNNELIREYKNDFIFALGHSAANYDEAKTSLHNGVKRITHLYNAMSGFHHHDTGIVNAIFNKEYKDDLCIELISDGVHVDNEVIKYTYDTLGVKNLTLVTDALPAKGTPDGKYKLANLDIEKKGNWFYLLNSNTLSGSACSFDYIVKNFYNVTKCSLNELVLVSSYNSAKNFKLLDKGYGDILLNTKANLVFLNENLDILNVIINKE